MKDKYSLPEEKCWILRNRIILDIVGTIAFVGLVASGLYILYARTEFLERFRGTEISQFPDETWVKRHFVRLIKLAPSRVVTNLYHAKFAGRDPLYIFRFDCHDQEFINALIKKHKLKLDMYPSTGRLPDRDALEWWPDSETFSTFTQAYEYHKPGDDDYKLLWIDTENERLYFQYGT